MKFFKVFFIGAALTALTTSCEGLLDTLSKNPVFEFTGTTVYDGQSAFLGTTATCKIGWTNHNPQIVTLDHNDQGKECVATFKLPTTAKSVTKVSLTATNLDDESVEPYTGEITVAPWRLSLYKQNGSNWERISNQTYNEVSGVVTTTCSYAKIGNGTYKVQMESKDSEGSYKAISSIPYRLGRLQNHDIDWVGQLVGANGHDVCKDTGKQFTLTESPTTSQIVGVTLGSVSHIFQLTK
ncbi:MAG: hypothetical protein IK008_06735 [Bacteroidales bacterium]|nr:hypothetical protein [Bacteroidales bacterium]